MRLQISNRWLVGIAVLSIFGQTVRSEVTVDDLINQISSITAGLPQPANIGDPALFNLVRLMNEKRYEDAIREAREIIRKDPNNIPARYMSAVALLTIKRYEAARIIFEQLLEKFPQHPFLLNNLAWLYSTAEDPNLRQPERALELARRAIMILPDVPQVWSTLSEAYYVNRQFDRALRAAEQALRLAQEVNAPFEQIATYEEQVAKCKEAVTAFSIFD